MDALAVAGDDSTLKAAVEMKLLKIEEGFRTYAEHQESWRQK
jgi:hypothetical protein